MLYELLSEFEYDIAKLPVFDEKFDFSFLKNKTVLISGEASFARAAALVFCAKNEEIACNLKIIIADRNKSCESLFSEEIIKAYGIAFTNISANPEIRPDYIIHQGICGCTLAGCPTEFAAETSIINHLASLAKNAGTERFILLSDDRVYRPCGEYSEKETITPPPYLPESYETQLASALESFAACCGRQYGFKLIILRTGYIISPFPFLQNSPMGGLLAKLAAEGKANLVSSTQKSSFIYITDALKAIMYALCRFKPGGAYNITSGGLCVSPNMLAAIISEKYPQVNISSDCNGVDLRGAAMRSLKANNAGFCCSVTLPDALELAIESYKKSLKPFVFKDSAGGRLTDLQSVLTSLLLTVDGICKKHGIKYFLAGGTLLGAVRHGGFIPWDDDADIMMLRGDYERFLQIVQSELPAGLFLHTHKSDPEYYNCFAKIRIDNTVFATEYSGKDMDSHNGIFIDILSHDQTADSALLKKLHLALTLLARSLVFNKQYNRRVDNGKKAASAIATALKKILPMKIHYTFQEKMFVFFKNKKNAKYLYDGMGRNIRRGSFPSEWLREAVYTDFEGYRLPIPKEYDNYLKYLYGDYMEMTPASLRKANHNIVEMDFGGL